MTQGGPRRVLLIVADQWRWECLSALGHPAVRTPNLDRLAREGVLFRNHFTQASPCGPARASLFTGLYMMTHRSVANGTPLDARFTNLALEARRAGLEAVLYGYTDASPDPRVHAPADPRLKSYEGLLPGFALGRYVGEDYKAWRAALQRKGYALEAHPTAPFVTAAEPGQAHSRAPALYRAEDSLAAYMTDEFLDFLAVNAEESWLACLAYLHPHPPLVAPAPYNALVDPADCPPPARANGPQAEGARHPYLDWLLGTPRRLKYHRDLALDTNSLDVEAVRRIRATYYGLMAELDTQLGRVIAALEAAGIYDETLIVFTADHGEMAGDHWLFGKDGFFDPAFHVPLIVRDPRPEADGARGRVVEAFSEAVDVTPTILEWLGAEVPAACDGESLLAFLRGETPAGWRDAAHWEFDFRDPLAQAPERALGLASDQCCLAVRREARWKYVHFAGLPPLLFDLEQDPLETRDLAHDPEHRAVALAMAQKMLSWRLTHAERTLANSLLTEEGVREHRGPRRAAAQRAALSPMS